MISTNFLIRTAILVLLLFLSAFFSGTETAFLSLTTLEKDRLLRSARGKRKRFFPLLFENPDEILITILSGNMIVNIFVTAIAEALGAEIFASSSELFSIIAVTIILIFCGELTPKNFAVYHAPSFSNGAAGPISFVHSIFRPLTMALSRIRNFAFSLFEKSNSNDVEIRHTAVMSAIQKGYRSGTLQEAELKLLESYFELRNKYAADVMIPRIDIPTIDGTASETEVIKRLSEGNDRYCMVYKDDIDHLTGYIDRIDLIKYRIDGTSFRLKDIQREVPVVYEKKNLSDLIWLLNEKQTAILLVIDEYGGTAGIVTHQTIVERLFEDFFPDEDNGLQDDSSGGYLIKGSMEVDELREELGTKFASDARTVGGLVVELLDEIPVPGQEITVDHLHIRVEEVENNRVLSVRITKIS